MSGLSTHHASACCFLLPNSILGMKIYCQISPSRHLLSPSLMASYGPGMLGMLQMTAWKLSLIQKRRDLNRVVGNLNHASAQNLKTCAGTPKMKGKPMCLHQMLHEVGNFNLTAALSRVHPEFHVSPSVGPKLNSIVLLPTVLYIWNPSPTKRSLLIALWRLRRASILLSPKDWLLSWGTCIAAWT